MKILMIAALAVVTLVGLAPTTAEARMCGARPHGFYGTVPTCGQRTRPRAYYHRQPRFVRPVAPVIRQVKPCCQQVIRRPVHRSKPRCNTCGGTNVNQAATAKNNAVVKNIKTIAKDGSTATTNITINQVNQVQQSFNPASVGKLTGNAGCAATHGLNKPYMRDGRMFVCTEN